jgi:hypothetical protein
MLRSFRDDRDLQCGVVPREIHRPGARTIVVQNAGNGAFMQQDVASAGVIHSVFHSFCEEPVTRTTVI